MSRVSFTRHIVLEFLRKVAPVTLLLYFVWMYRRATPKVKSIKTNIDITMNSVPLWAPHEPDDAGACAVCKKTTKHRCTACKTVYYCCTDHQKLHWKSDHKKNCGLIELVNDSYIGQHYIAKRDIEPGEIVLREKGPLVIFINGTDFLICVNCYTDLRSEKINLCKKCGWWPLCAKCTQHGAECEFTIKYGKFKYLPDKGKSAREKVLFQNSGIGIIRILALRDTNPKAYLKFMKHEDHYGQMKAHYGDELDADVAKLVSKYFNVRNVEESEMAKIHRILLISGFGYRNHDSYFAEKTSYFEHNCRPNCSKTIPDKDGSFLVWAVTRIAAGEHVSICYNKGDMGTMMRKNWLRTTKFFDCTCSRCEDPTEFETMFNAVKCIKNRCEGDMLPATFKISLGKYPDFVCRQCKAVVPSKDVDIMQLVAEKQLSVIQQYDDVYSYKRFIEEHADIFHKNHFLIVIAKLKLADVLGFDAYTESDVTIVPNDELNEKIRLSEEIRELHELLMPGYTRCRGRLLYGIAIALGEKCKREIHDRAKVDILMNKYIMTLTETYKLLCYEAQSSEEGQMAREAMKLLQRAKVGLI